MTDETTPIPSPSLQSDSQTVAEGTAAYVEVPVPEGTGAATMFGDSPSVLPGDDTANSRTKRVNVAMADKSPGVAQIKSDLLNGKEPEIRKLFAAQKDAELRELKIDMVKTFAAEKARRNETINDDDIRFVQELSREQVHNPDTIFETEYARQYFNNLVQMRRGNHVLASAMNKDPEGTTREIEAASSIKARMEIVKTGLENLRDRWEKAGFWESAGTYGAMFVPFLENYRLHNVSTENTDSIFPGSNLEEQVQNMWTLPPQAFAKRFKETVDGLAEKNLMHAMKFAEAVLKYGASDKHLDNAFAILDTSDVATLGLGKAAVSLARGARRGVQAVVEKATEEAPTAAKVALKDALKADASPAPKPIEKVIAESGDLETAGTVTAWKDAKKTIEGQDPFGDRHRLIQAVPSLFNPYKVLAGAKDLSAEVSRRLTTALFGNAANLLESMSKTTVTRLPEGSDALAVGLRKAADDLSKMHAHLNDAVLDTAHVHVPVVNVHFAELQVGKRATPPVVKKSDPKDFEKYSVDSQFDDLSAEIDAERAGYNLKQTSKRNTAGGPTYKYDITGKDGKVGEMRLIYFEKSGDIFIDNVEAIGPNKIGPREVRKLLGQLRKDFPDAKTVSGERGTGARSKTPLGLQLSDEGRAELVSVPLSSPKIVTDLGKPNATFFKNPNEAAYWGNEIYKLNPDSYRIKENQQGLGFYLSIEKAVDETGDGVRDVLINTKTQTPRSIFNTLFGRVRTPEDTLSELSRANRHTITHGAQEIQRLAREVAQNISSLSNKSKDKLNRILKHNQDFEYNDPDSTKLRRGRYYSDVGEFDREWRSFHGVSPSDAERVAYFSAVQLNDWDYVLRNLGLYRDKARQGIERFRWFVPTGEGGTLSRTDYIEGKRVSDLPWEGRDNFGVYFFDPDTQKAVHFNKRSMTSEERARITDAIQTRKFQVIQVANPLDKPLRKYVETEDSIHFIVVPDAERGTLDWKQLAYRAGGHTEYKHRWWTKQVRVRQTESGWAYEGDTTIFNFATEGEARKYAERMNSARILLKDGKMGDLEKYLEQNLPYTLQQFKSLFEPKKAPDGSDIPAALTLNEPIRHVQSGRNVLDDHADIARQYENFTNDIRSEYNLYGQIDKKYAGERDPAAWTVRERQGVDEPLFKLEDAPFIDPLSTLQKGLANVIRSRYFNDYKIQSVETWIAEFADVLMEKDIRVLRNDPIGALHTIETDKLHSDKAKVAAADNARRAILNLLGTESQLSKNLHSMQEGVLSSIYTNYGQSKSDWIANHMLPVTKDPFHYMRAIAFHSKLGLFNPVQLFLQAQTLTHVAAVSGISNAIPGMFGATLMRRLSLTNDANIIAHMGKMAEKFGWKQEDFIESYNALKKTGLYNVEGEVAMRDDVFDPKLFQGSMGAFLDKGTFFFREGERLVRLTAWNAAYREWKLRNPGKALTKNEDIQEVLVRQNTLSVNMTRASNASWQQGIMSVPTQFFSYQARLMEQFLGKRLTASEKAYAFTVYSAMYGVPTALGAVTAVWPWYEDFRQAAMESSQFDPNGPGMKMFTEGIPSLMWSVITGNDQNWAQRYGPGGLSFFKDIFVKGKVEQVFGASPSILAGMIQSADPIVRGVVSVFRPEAEKFEFIAADFINAVNNISTLNNIGKMMFALNTGKFVSKNEIYLGEATPLDAILSGIAGTTPQEISDAFLKSFSLQQQEKAQAEIEKEVIKHFRRAIRAGYEGNESTMAANMKNARILMIGGGFRADQQADIFRKAMSGQESFVSKINQDFWKKARVDEWASRLEATFGIKIPNK